MNLTLTAIHRAALAALIAVLLALSSGCNTGDKPELVPVKGRVTLDGQPLADAYVVFQSDSGGRGSKAITRSDGSYELQYLRNLTGARLGKHRVTISTAIEGNPIERVPRKYNKESTLSAVVSDEGKPIDFALFSK